MTNKPMNLHQKLVEIRRNIGSISKDTKGFNYSYVSGTQVLSRIQHTMNELGVLLYPDIQNQNFEKHSYVNSKGKDCLDFLVYGHMTYTWVNADNPEDKLSVPFYYCGSQDDLPKAFGAGLTYSERYFIIKFFNLPTDGDDPDARSRGGYNNQQQQQNYQNNQQPQYNQPPAQQQQQYQQGTDNNLITPAQLTALKTAVNAAATRTKMDKGAVADYAKMKLNVPAEIESKALTRQQASAMINFISQLPAAQAAN